MTNDNLDSQLSKLRIDKDRKRVRRRRVPWSWILIPLLVAGAAYMVYSKANAPLLVRTGKIEQEAVASGKGPALVTASGYVVPRHKVEVSSKIIGRVKEVKVKRGDHVNQGDMLLKIDDEEFQARVRSAQAQVATLQANVAELKAGSRPQEIDAAKANVASAEVTLREARANFERSASLERQGITSKQELDRDRAARDVAQARLDAARKNSEIVKIGPRQEQIDAAEAQLREAEANLEYAQTELAYTIIHAPITGIILEKLAEEGELVTNTNFGGTRGAKSSVVSMADLTDLQVEVDVNEAELAKVKLRQPAEIRLDSAPKQAYAGEVDEISPQADRQKGTVQVKVRIIDPDDLIKTEVTARATFLGEASPPNAAASGRPRLWIPATAVVRDGADAVYIMEGGKAVAKPVKLGATAEKGVEVTEGLTGSETLIISPVEKLTNGLRVAPEL